MEDIHGQSSDEKEVNSTAVCKKCGAVLYDGQKFCAQCGAQREEKVNFCSKCGTQLIEGQEFCHKCGYKVGLAVEPEVISTVNQNNTVNEKKKKKKKKKSIKVPIVIGVVCGLTLGLMFPISGFVSDHKAEVAKEEYIHNAKEFASLSYDAGSNLEVIEDTIQSYWYECINNSYEQDVDAAISDALDIMEDELSLAEDYDLELEEMYSKIERVPHEISEDDEDDMEEIRDTIKEMYETYCKYYILATEPNDSYELYSEENDASSTKFFSDCYALCELLD